MDAVGAGALDLFQERLPHGRVDDGVERRQRLGVAEHAAREVRPVEAAGRVVRLRPEGLDELAADAGVLGHDPLGHVVRQHHADALLLGEAPDERRLPAPDAASYPERRHATRTLRRRGLRPRRTRRPRRSACRRRPPGSRLR